MIASFSRALYRTCVNGKATPEFDRTLGTAIDEI